MPAFAEKYTDAQRDAVSHAYNDRGIRPAKRIQELARAGELTWKGAPLEPFEMPLGSILGYAATERKRRQGKVKSTVASMPPRDGIEALRRRLMAALDAHITDYEKKQRKPGADPDPQFLSQIARAMREVAAIPGPKEPRPVAPGQRKPEGGHERGDPRTKGLAAQVIAATRNPQRGSEAETAEKAQPTRNGNGDQTGDAAQLAPQLDAEVAQTGTELGPDRYARSSVGVGSG